jgi:hypothetical protein
LTTTVAYGRQVKMCLHAAVVYRQRLLTRVGHIFTCRLYPIVAVKRLIFFFWLQLIRATRHPPCTASAHGVHSLSTSEYRVITTKRCAVNQCTLRGQRVNAAWSTNFRVSVNKWTLDPRVGNAHSTQGKHASSELSPIGPLADRAWRAYDWGGPVTIRSWYSERIPIQCHIKNTSRRRWGGAEWVPGGSNELWPLGYSPTATFCSDLK